MKSKFFVFFLSLIIILTPCFIFADSGDFESSEPSSEPIYNDVSLNTVVLTSTGTDSLKDIILDLIGPYEMIVTDHTYQNSSSSYLSHSIDISYDWPWIISACIFALFCYLTLKIACSFIWRR